MKSRSCLLIFTLVAVSLTSCGQQKSSQEIAETVKNSIVLISYQNERGHGTGFIVPGPTGVCTVLTARHVVEGRSLNLRTNDEKSWKTKSIQLSPSVDLAVVTFKPIGETCSYPSLNFGNSDSVKVGDKIYIQGFPDQIGSSKLGPQFVQGYVSRLDILEQGYGISYDASTFGGMSGGPVLDVSGKVVAVHGKTDAQIVADLQSQQASLSPQQQAALQQAAVRVAGGVQINTFRWGIFIRNYLENFNTNYLITDHLPPTMRADAFYIGLWYADFFMWWIFCGFVGFSVALVFKYLWQNGLREKVTNAIDWFENL